LDFLNLVSGFDGKTIKLPVLLDLANDTIKLQVHGYQLILDTGADTTALTEEFLMKNGYALYHKSGTKKRTITGETELLTCEINGLTIANQFKVAKMRVDVLIGWGEHTVVGVIGMDILSRLTFILSHEHKMFLLSAQSIPELAKLFS
jgi:predicted aspartyl protease